MKTYYIILYVFFTIALYNFIYINFLYDKTYLQYVREYHNAGNTLPQYSIEDDTSNEPDTYEFYGISKMGKYLNLFYLNTYIFIIALFLPLLVYGIIILFFYKKYLDFKWWFTQLIIYIFLFYIVTVLINFM
ncbi:MAG: hypothetical protein LBQ22_04420 [Bacteroidales bacterium]|nr:hypothetical protein [Bacteroidales bacterium]